MAVEAPRDLTGEVTSSPRYTYRMRPVGRSEQDHAHQRLPRRHLLIQESAHHEQGTGAHLQGVPTHDVHQSSLDDAAEDADSADEHRASEGVQLEPGEAEHVHGVREHGAPAPEFPQQEQHGHQQDWKIVLLLSKVSKLRRKKKKQVLGKIYFMLKLCCFSIHICLKSQLLFRFNSDGV